MKIIKHIWLIILTFAFSCNNQIEGDEKIEDNNKGAITIICDSDYEAIVTELIKSYINIYDSAAIHIQSTDEQNAIQLFLENKEQFIFIGRKLMDNEIKIAEQNQGFIPKQFTIAYDAIAIVTGKQVQDSIFDLDAFLQIQNKVDAMNYNQSQFIFENKRSGVIEYFLQTRNVPDVVKQKMFGLDSLSDFVTYLNYNDNAIGFISFTELSDNDSKEVIELKNKLHILDVLHTDSLGKRVIVELSQSTILTQDYPLIRPINVVLGNTSQRLGTGFVNFLFKSKAQRIFLKDGLIPQQIPERQIIITVE